MLAPPARLRAVHRPDAALATSRVAAVLAALSLAVSLLGVTPAAAVNAVKRALSAKNADAVDGISASRTPQAGQLLALGSDGSFPASALRSGMRGPRGGEGPRGQSGAAGAAGPPGLAAVRFAAGATKPLPRQANLAIPVVRLDNVPPGKWLIFWSAAADYVGPATSVFCQPLVGSTPLPGGGGVAGLNPGSAWGMSFSGSEATVQNGPFDVVLSCLQNHEIAPGEPIVELRSQRLVAIRADDLVSQ